MKAKKVDDYVFLELLSALCSFVVKPSVRLSERIFVTAIFKQSPPLRDCCLARDLSFLNSLLLLVENMAYDKRLSRPAT